MEILCVFAGIAFVYTESLYPLIMLVISFFFRPGYSAFVAFSLAIIWGMLHLWWVDDRGMPDARVLSKAELKGRVVSLPISNSNKTQFEFAAHELNGKKVSAVILISCYQHCPHFKVGQTWSFEAKLKKPENLANPGHFDFVGGLNARHIHWTGYIKHFTKLHPNISKPQSLLIFREKLALTFAHAIPDTAVLGILQALTLGLTTHIDKLQWDLFRRTGTTHLMVISGSHIGLIVGFSYWLMKWLWSRSSRLCLSCPAAKIATAAALFMGAVYALLAGFAPPSQRSLLACIFLLLRNFLNCRFTVWQAWRYGLLAVLIYEPHAVLLPGFYLSFIAVAILILINQRVAGSKLKKAICIQLACLIGLMPLSLYWFSYGAVNGLLANLLAIPWVGFIIVPLSLISLFLLHCFNIHYLVTPIKIATEWLLHFLQWVDSFSVLNLDCSYTELLSPLALMLVMLLILFLPIKAIFPAIIVLFFSSLFPGHQKIKLGEAKIDFLDVGQGLAVVVNTANHSLIYDTGMKFYQGGDMGKLAIIPYLNTLGINKIDKVIISHPDLDHRGGLASLEEKYPIADLLVDKVSYYHRGKACHHYPAWQWDKVTFRFLAIGKRFRNKNNSSCVLQIENEAGRILLAGDIEKLAENYLVATYGNQLRSEVLLVPHHGSKTSSSLAFIEQVAPHYAVISSGFDNRYHFPHQQTLNTFKKQKIAVYNTAECGMASVKLGRQNDEISTSCYKNTK
ncbi:MULTISPECIES: DNA internalization-related competence protein ComEC/Rec2 [Legionella]|uniref:DNA uptake/competence protein ComA n=1 Tax=Legionella drozanskii LLAP-1 TaxID=1212489 RepID=A0A0W0SKP9_9GAMM|nr:MULTISPECIES: DNA internalization-related competence protein ComEC/Rec2 [Legionella]KTC83978.1 DNA uptake/competence protein ComA [Legionella drozanskii LLAP-1]PJE15853.1 MAG: DNA internalization-related competence protein ComEC/Rec2 [Legionella sp.]